MLNELSSRFEDSESPMEHVELLTSNRFTKKELIEACCRPTYNMRKVKNKGAIVVLIMSFFLAHLYYIVADYHVEQSMTEALFIAWGITLPLVGWLADVRLGRHRMIHLGMWIMWIALILETMSSVVEQLMDSYTHAKYFVNLPLLILVTIGFGCYQGNVIQFGTDQLQDASTDEITSFISWYVWSAYSGGIIVGHLKDCIQEGYIILMKLLVCFTTSVALLIWSLLSEKMLIKEPVTQNPFKLLYQILKYAIKNKQPRCRSAFTYCEDELPSRIDFGKSKYGGPFTTEQVEDVKTFFRLLPVILFASIIPSTITAVHQLSLRILTHSQIPGTVECYLNTNIFFYTPMVIIPFYEFAVFPVLRRHLYWVKSSFKLLLGVILQMARVFTLMALVLKARHSYLEHNTTMQCILAEYNGDRGLAFNSKWMVLPNILNSISVVTLAIGGIEFLCAQTPYSMRGLIFGTVYGCIAIYGLVGHGITQLFRDKYITWGTGTISCEFWYLLLHAFLLGITGVMLFVLGMLYKKRKREDVLPNEQVFAERYYSS